MNYIIKTKHFHCKFREENEISAVAKHLNLTLNFTIVKKKVLDYWTHGNHIS